MVSEIPGQFKAVTAGFDAEHLQARGMTMLSKQNIEVGGYPGVLLEVTQEAFGQPFRKWLLVFGDSETVVLTATWPEALTGTLQASLKQCLLSARWVRSEQVDPTAGLNYSIKPVPPLKLTRRLQSMLLFSPSGQLAVKTPGAPVFVIGPSIVELDVGDHAAYANKRLRQHTDLQEFQVRSEQAVKIAGLPGWEILASAKDSKTQVPRLLYQTILFGDKVYYIMQGMVDWPSRQDYERVFKDTARTFALK